MGKHGINFCAFDMSGQSRYRNLWEHYYGDVEGIIVVVDATDKLRFAVVKDELETMLKDEKVQERKIPVLFLCNKMDLPTASKPAQVMEFSRKLGYLHFRDWPRTASHQCRRCSRRRR